MPKATAPPPQKGASNQNIHRRVHAWDIHVKVQTYGAKQAFNSLSMQLRFVCSWGSYRYLHTSWTCSTKRLSQYGGKWTCIFVFFALCSPTAQSPNMVTFAWSWTLSDTFPLHEDAPQNHLWSGWAVVVVSKVAFLCFLPDVHQLLSHLLWSVLHDLWLF